MVNFIYTRGAKVPLYTGLRGNIYDRRGIKEDGAYCIQFTRKNNLNPNRQY